MVPLGGILGALWLAVLIASPRRPALVTNEAAWLIYSRQYGAWHRLFLTAIIATLIALFLGIIVLIHDANSDLFRLRNACVPQAIAIAAERDTCWSLSDDGRWQSRSVWN